jgi:hypothetical protein
LVHFAHSDRPSSTPAIAARPYSSATMPPTTSSVDSTSGAKLYAAGRSNVPNAYQSTSTAATSFEA